MTRADARDTIGLIVFGICAWLALPYVGAWL
jgi:hypothetical protein